MNQKVFDLYGFESNNLDEKTEMLEKVLDVKFVLRNSGYLGDYNNYRGENGESLELRYNLDAEKYFAEPEHKDLPLLFYVYDSNRVDEVKKLLTEKIPEIVFIRRNVYD